MPPPPRTGTTQPVVAAARLAATSPKPPPPPPAPRGGATAEGRAPAITMTSATGDLSKPGRGSGAGKKARRQTLDDVKPTMLSAVPSRDAAQAKAAPSLGNAGGVAQTPPAPSSLGNAVGVAQTPPTPSLGNAVGVAQTAPTIAGPPPGARAPAPTTATTEQAAPGTTTSERAGGIGPTQPALDEETARLLEDLDAGFDSIVRPTVRLTPEVRRAVLPREELRSAPANVAPAESEARAARHEADMTEVRELFAGIAVAYARPLRDFMIEIAWGQPTREWIEVALPATQALRAAAAAVELPGLDKALEGYQVALDLALGEPIFSQEVREMIASAYARLIDALPSVFALEGELVRREPIIVRSLLLQVPGVRYVAIEKLYRAGINALEVFYAARPRDLADATGLDEPTAAAICERFQRYRREIADLGPAQERAKERAELTALCAELVQHHDEHEKAAAAWTPDAASRRSVARKERAETAVRIDLLLARMGEIDLQRTIAKLPFQQKIRELYRFLEEANQRAGR